MTNRIRREVGARHIGRAIRMTIGADVRNARLGAGLSIDAAAAAVGMSSTMFGRIERGTLESVTVEQLCLACAAVGLRFSGRAYPGEAGPRDAGHARLLERFRARLPPGSPWQTEVPLPIPGDLRAWDAMTELVRTRIAIEAEMRLVDAQSVDRRIALKRRDSGIAITILLLPDTNTNRAALATCRAALRANFPLDTRGVLHAMSAGRPPTASGIVVL